MQKAKRIDVHMHVTLHPDLVPDCKWGGRMLTAEEHMEYWDKIDIDYGVLLPIVAPEGQLHPMPCEDAKIVADKYPDKFAWFCNIDPRFMNNAETTDFKVMLQHYKNLGAKGVGEITSNMHVDDPRVQKLFAACAELDMPVTIHVGFKEGGCYGIIDDLHLPKIEKLLQDYPNLKLIGHSQPFWMEMGTDVTEENRNNHCPTTKVEEGRIAYLMRKYPNLYGDLSAGSGSNALMRDEEYAIKFIEEFSDRLMYGCDICAKANDLHYKFDAWLNRMVDEGKISIENYNKIVRENAIRILKLDI